MKPLLLSFFRINCGFLLVLLFPLLVSATSFPHNPVVYTSNLSEGEQVTSSLQSISFIASHPGSSFIVDTEDRELLINGEDRTDQTTVIYNDRKTFTVVYQPTEEFPLPEGDVSIDFVTPMGGWEKWKKIINDALIEAGKYDDGNNESIFDILRCFIAAMDGWTQWIRKKCEARIQYSIYVDSIAPEVLQIAPAPGETILDLLQILQFKISDNGSGIDENTLVFSLENEDKTAQTVYAAESLTYSPTEASLLPPQNFQASVAVADLLGNQTTASFDFQVQPEVVLSATPRAVPQTAYAPATIHFTPEVTTANAIQLYEWDFNGDGTYDRSDVVGNGYSWQYTNPGDYTVTLRVRDKLGEIVTGSITVEIQNATPTVVAEASPSNGSIPLEVAFSATVTDNEGVALFEWDFEGDGSFDYSSTTSASTSHTYLDAGQFIATLRVTDNFGDVSSYVLPTTAVNAAAPGSPTVTAVSNKTSGVSPLTVTLSAVANDPQGHDFVLWEWDFDGDGSYDYSSSDEGPASHTYVKGGRYYPQVRVTTDDNRSSSDVVAIKVENNLTLSRNQDTIDTTLSQSVSIATTLSGTTRVSLIVEDRDFNRVRTLVEWTEREGGSYTDIWDGLKDDMSLVAEGDYYAVLLYEEDGMEKRLDHRTSNNDIKYIPSRNNASRSFSPFNNNPMAVTYQLPVASEVTAFVGYSMSNIMVVTFLNRKPQAKGSHTIRWYGTNNEGMVIYPPSNRWFMFGVWAYRLADNGIYVKSGSHVMAVSPSPPIYDPTTHDEDGERATSKISFTLTGDATVELSITDASTGTLAAIRTYPGLGGGANTIEWDGRNQAGDFLAPGKYRLGVTAIDENGYRSLTEYSLQRIYY